MSSTHWLTDSLANHILKTALKINGLYMLDNFKRKSPTIQYIALLKLVYIKIYTSKSVSGSCKSSSIWKKRISQFPNSMPVRARQTLK